MSPHFPLDRASYAFADCIVDLPKHEVSVGGQARKLTPRAFALLVYLIERRARVVPVNELLDGVWRGSCLTPDVVARAVMQVRAALGDRPSDSLFIRSVQRVGYRFVAKVDLVTNVDLSRFSPSPPQTLARPGPDGSWPLLPPVALRYRLAVLPLRNAAGPDFAWVELGLLSLLDQALRAEERLHRVPLTTTLNALGVAEGEGAGAGSDRVGAVQRLIDGCWVCDGSIARDADGFVLDYRLVAPGGQVRASRLRRPEPTALARDLAQAIEEHLFGGTAVTVRLATGDPLANQAFTRAVLAREERNAESALQLIRTALDIEPDGLAVRLEHLQILGVLMDPSLYPLAEQMLQEALARSDAATAAQIHVLLARTLMQQEGLTERARRHGDEAWRLTGPDRHEEGALRVYRLCAVQATRAGEAERARLLFDAAENVCEQTADRLERSLLMMNRAALEASEGNLLTARGLWDRALATFRQFDRRVYMLTTLLNLSAVNAALGFQAAALAHADSAAGLLAAFQRYDESADDLAALCIRYAEAGRPQAIRRLIEVVTPAGTGSAVTGARQVALSQWHGCLGEFVVAGELLSDAIDMALDAGLHWYASQWVSLWLHNEMRAGRTEKAYRRAQQWLALPVLAGCADLIGMALQVQALQCYAQGDAQAARRHLTEALAAMPPGRWSAQVRLDAAWLDIEAGQVERAGQMLSAAHAWPSQHPLGLLVQARRQLELGHFDEARQALAASLSLRPSETPEVMALAFALEAARPGQGGVTGPGQVVVTRLPSCY